MSVQNGDRSGFEDRLYEVEARLAIQDLEGKYAAAWDTADADGWAALFTEDGVFEMAEVGDLPGVHLQGRQELAGFCSDINQRFQGLHLIHVPSIWLDGTTAHGRAHFRFEYLQQTDSAQQICTVTGVYTNVYVLAAQGWRIQHRHERAVLRQQAAFFPGFE